MTLIAVCRVAFVERGSDKLVAPSVLSLTTVIMGAFKVSSFTSNQVINIVVSGDAPRCCDALDRTHHHHLSIQ